jgi:hypothetical protein
LTRTSEERIRSLGTATALELVGSGQCPACRFVEDRERAFFFWFAYEQYQEPEVINDLDRALGFCPRHNRALVRARVYPGTLTHLYLHVALAARAAIGDVRRSDAPCPACAHDGWAAGYAIGVLLRTLTEDAVAAAYAQSPGLCSRHFLYALRTATRAEIERPMRLFEQRVSEDDVAGRNVALFTGIDVDAPQRLDLRRRLPEESADEASTLEQLGADLALDACPACLAAGRATRRYVCWLSTQRRNGSNDFARELVGLCASHLADAHASDPEAAQWLVLEKSVRWQKALGRLRGEVEKLPAAGVGARLRFVSRWINEGKGERRERRRTAEDLFEIAGTALEPRRAFRRAASRFEGQFPGCGACRAESTAQGRMLALIAAALLDRRFARQYEHAHGLCVRHVLSWPDTDRTLPAEVCSARLALLRWELEESDRKRDWLIRYEADGPEATAWRRAMAQIDGRVFLGNPAVTRSE